ncbi:distal tail protein Dit [Clostridium manihotivorum]|uniref:Phage tail protein n=1 Tax=Clostridium manihotivorum TaxID=2320868 RepID=A0A3R5V6F9_9CLOT|nr:distal tail protein Dit [Clostridium manihotivorum]QAA31249.1 phage tail protein [Clostridium manihotivorum]
MLNWYSIFFNNKDSLRDLNLNIEQRPNFPVPERDIRIIDIDGRNGSLTRDLGTYKDIPVPISFNLVDRNDIHQTVRNVKRWLIGNIDNRELIQSDDPDYFYKVKQVKVDKEIERMLWVAGKFTATFLCAPFQYSRKGQNTISLRKPGEIYNEGTFQSEPLITIYGMGNITIVINGSLINLKNIDEYMIIDSVSKDAYKDSINMNNSMIGAFPILQEGVNSITWSGNVDSVEIVPNWCYL